MKKYLYMFIVLLIMGCSANNSYQPTIFKNEYIPIMQPSWIVNIPEGEFEIGISQKYWNEKEQEKSAREFATVNYNRNKHSVIINKLAKVQGEEVVDYKSFKLNVSSKVSELKEFYKSLTLIDTAYIGSYYLALFYKGEAKPKIRKKKVSTMMIPNWFNQNEVFTDKKYIYATIKYSSADLAKAINGAMEKARFKIASYKNQHVRTVSKTTYQNTKKAFSLETQTLLGNLKTINIYILKKRRDNALYSYEIYLKMRGEK